MTGQVAVSLRVRLSALMFLQYAALGVWAVTLPTYLMAPPHEGGLNLSAAQVGVLFCTTAVGAMVSPLLAGVLADRLFPTQRVLAGLHLCGAALLLATSAACTYHQAAAYQVLLPESPIPTKNSTFHDPHLGGSSFVVQTERVQDAKAYLRDPAHYDPEREHHIYWKGSRTTHWVTETLAPLGVRTGFPLLSLSRVDRVPFEGEEQARRVIDSANRRAREIMSEPANAAALSAASDHAFGHLLLLFILYALLTQPTSSLANSLCLRNLPDPAHQFGAVRALGTFGWTFAGLFNGLVLTPVSPLPLLAGASLSALLGLVCLIQPHTPPGGKARTAAEAFGLPVFRLFADRSFLVFALTTLVVTMAMKFHDLDLNKFLTERGVVGAAAYQTIGQYAEVACILSIPAIRRLLGTKGMLILGLLASAARFGFYAWGYLPAVYVLGLPMHGVSYSFFFIAATLYVDAKAPRGLRASAQGLVTVTTLGPGAFLGNLLSGRVVDACRAETGVVDWPTVWLWPAILTLAAVIPFALLFREPKVEAPVDAEPTEGPAAG